MTPTFCHKACPINGPALATVVFADRFCFLLHKVDGCVRIRRLAGERLAEDCLQPVVAQGRGYIHVWGALLHGGKLTLVILDGNVTGAIHTYILG